MRLRERAIEIERVCVCGWVGTDREREKGME
jgi:hypothetical protein